jgi:hypothetical protein
MRTRLDKLTEGRSKDKGHSHTSCFRKLFFFSFRLLFPFGTLGKKMTGNRYPATRPGH